MIRALKWKNIAQRGQAFHLARIHFRKLHALQQHTQDFYELFWIEHGRAMHQINERSVLLETGNLVFMRNTDKHGFRALDPEGFVIVNIAFPAAVVNSLGRLYLPGSREWFWSRKRLPEVLVGDTARLSWLARWVSRLGAAESTRLEIDLFLMELLRDLSGTAPPPSREVEPPWLTTLMQQLENPSVMAGGTRGLARLAGRTPQHVNAATKRFRGLTATELINDARMRFAMRELRTSTKKILEICLDCGFDNLSHFYEIFRRHAGVTPRTYRLQHQELLR